MRIRKCLCIFPSKNYDNMQYATKILGVILMMLSKSNAEGVYIPHESFKCTHAWKICPVLKAYLCTQVLRRKMPLSFVTHLIHSLHLQLDDLIIIYIFVACLSFQYFYYDAYYATL